jgi:xanthine dehydrogenase accessory factor
MYFPIQMQELTKQIEITPQTYIVLTTRGVDVDVPGLPTLLQSKAGYIGIIGSRRRWAETRKVLIKEGVNKDDLERIHSPIGLGIGAETPEEIAVSILAQIIMLREGGSGKPMRESR